MRPETRRRLGRTDIQLTQLGLGAAPLGELFEPVSEDQAERVLQTAWDCGVRYYDTAPFYGMGMSEHRVGRFIRSVPRDEVVLSTKVGRILHRPRDARNVEKSVFVGGLPFEFHFDYSYDGIMRSFEDSIQRLGVSAIDLLVIHDLGFLHHLTEARLSARFAELATSGWRALEELRRDGVVKAVGAGVNELGVIPRILDVTDVDFFLVAMRYTLLDQSAYATELQLCRDRECGVIIGAVFNSGILATGSVAGAKYDYGDAAGETLERVRALEDVCRAFDVALPAAALQFPLGHDLVASVIPGGVRPEQVAQNAAFLREPIPAAFWDELKGRGLLAADIPTPDAH